MGASAVPNRAAPGYAEPGYAEPSWAENNKTDNPRPLRENEKTGRNVLVYSQWADETRR